MFFKKNFNKWDQKCLEHKLATQALTGTQRGSVIFKNHFVHLHWEDVQNVSNATADKWLVYRNCATGWPFPSSIHQLLVDALLRRELGHVANLWEDASTLPCVRKYQEGLKRLLGNGCLCDFFSTAMKCIRILAEYEKVKSKIDWDDIIWWHLVCPLFVSVSLPRSLSLPLSLIPSVSLPVFFSLCLPLSLFPSPSLSLSPSLFLPLCLSPRR